MKTITKFFILVAAMVAFASNAKAQATIDFETVGNTWTWTVFSNGTGGGDDASLLTIPANNPNASGINTSAHCAKLEDAATANPWGGAFSTGIGSITFTANNCIVKVMVYKNVISNFDLKFEGGAGGTSIETQVPNTKINQWEELTIDLTGQIGNTYTKLTIIPDFPATRTAGSINYFDNISFNAGSSTPPTSVPTTTLTPTVASGKAIFTYNSSAAYTNAALLSMTPDNAWGGLFVASSYPINGKNVICLTPSSTGGGAGVYYHGGDLASTIDVSGMKYLHVDIWVPAALEFTNLGVSPISTGGNQYLYNLESASGFTKGSWNSIDIPLTTFTAGTVPSPVNLSSVFQFIVKSDQAAGITSIPNNTVYIDNIYYWTDVTVTLTVSATSVSVAQPANSTGSFNVTASQNWNVASNQSWLTVSPTSGTSAGGAVTLTASANTTSAIRTATVTVTGADNTVKTVTVTQAGLPIPASPTPTSVASDVVSIYSDFYTAAATNLQFQSWYAAPWSTVTLADNGSAQMIAASADGSAGGIQFDNLNISAMSFVHFDVYPTTGTTTFIKYNVVPVGGGGAGWTAFSGLIANQWNRVNVPVSSLGFAGPSVFQIGFGTFGGFGTFYVDNIFFSKTASALKEIESQNGVKCYPGIVSDKLTINSNTEMSQIVVHNLLGQTIKDMNANDVQQVIDMNNVPAGNYFVTVKLANGKVSNLKFIKL